MTQRYSCKITLAVLGPFLTAATGPDRYGMAKSAHRNHAGQMIIPASHCKGKLRWALQELAPFMEESTRPNLDALFGAPSAEGSYEPNPALLRFTDLVCAAPARDGTRTRVAIDRVSQTAGQNLLREVEDPLASGSQAVFSGRVIFSAPDSSAAEGIARVLRLGFAWLANVGAEKGVGFGRVRTVQVSTPVAVETKQRGAPKTVNGSSFHLRIAAQEPLLAGGLKSRRTNYIVSRKELPGGLIKGALTVALNEAYGISPVTRPLDASHAADYGGFAALVTHFSAIRVTHAWPALAGSPRPVRLPLSLVEHEGALAGDVALSDEPTPLVQGKYSPAYLGDAKSLQPFEGSADPMELFVTRSEIDDVSQRTAEGQLFTYQFYAPYNESRQPIEWICNVDCAAVEDPAQQLAAAEQFAEAVQQYLHRLGKLGRMVTVTVEEGLAPAAVACRDRIEDGLALVTLQSDAIMLAPEVVRALELGSDLHEAYAAYWRDISDGAVELVDFFAHQGFEGGYLYHRRLGAAERTARPDRYRPYYLTLAGSIFKLRVIDEALAAECLDRFLASGLPLPPWALAEYGQYQRDFWENCPFVPENGYGEIAVNLACHWDHRI
jgi:hypothetical protein